LRIVIIGGVAGGMSAATRARRMNERAQITVIERGGFVSFANCGLPYHIAGRIAREEKLLVTTAEKVKARYRIDARVLTEAVQIDRTRKVVTVRDVRSGARSELGYDRLILAMGAEAIVPAIEGLKAKNVFTIKSMEDARAVQKFLEETRFGGVRVPRGVVVGGGFIGLEMAEALHDRGMAVTVVEKMGRVLPPVDPEMAVDVEGELRAHGVEVMTGVGLSDVRAKDGMVRAVVLEDGRQIGAEMVILSIGVRPNVGLAKEAGLAIGARGAVAVNGAGQTNDPDIYAVGDMAEVVHGVTGKAARVPLAGPANRAGRLAGEHAAAVDDKVRGQIGEAAKVMGTAIVQVFSLAIGVTGLNERSATAAGFEVDTVYVTANDHAGYYPGATPIRLKVVYEKKTGRLLGGQAIGRAGVDKRIDVLATALHFGGTLEDLAGLDLAYAPQFGSAKDVLHMAGFTGQNQRTGVTPSIVPGEINGRQVVDVRTAEEVLRGKDVRAVAIPVDALRERVGELDAARPTAVYCQSGLRGHVAVRILKQRGFGDVVNVRGGWELMRRVAGDGK
jgi:NADPH-dependent 2,4-dienoyl-CoA reductase/sulfur reductase-like enzyme/rhodanese-related sulfurtransferase